jgi:DNA-binding MarR family transcriptional regulator
MDESRFALRETQYMTSTSSVRPRHEWHFLTNHTQVLLCVAQNPDIRVRDVAVRVGITERAAQRILNDLDGGGYVTRERQGRRNRYRINPHAHLRHPAQAGIEIRTLLELLDGGAPLND